jgi:acyl-[acyl-carrier-protein]-phospholipid O-acyltransferase/long-chain-fatty-acid--[acyl-carrier-protein] ligase
MNPSNHIANELLKVLSKKIGSSALVDYGLGSPLRLKRGTLLVLAIRLAGDFKSEIKEDRVGVVLPPGLAGVLANLALFFADKIPVNLNFTLGSEAIKQSMEDAGVKTILTAKGVRKKFPEFPWLDNWIDLGEKLKTYRKEKFFLFRQLAWLRLFPRSFVRSHEVPSQGGEKEAALLFTSGSSGNPKGVALSHRNLLSNCHQISQVGLFSEDAKILANLPLFHSFGFTIATLYPLLDGLEIVAAPSPLDVTTSIRAIRDEKVEVLMGTPTFLRGYLRKGKVEDLASVRYVVAGAEKTPPPFRKKWEKEVDCKYLEGYGLTETSPVLSFNVPGEGSRENSVGRLLPGVESKVVDADTKEDLPDGESGILCFRGPNVFPGDLGRIDAEGFLFIEGRLSRFSKIGGEMVPHERVEEAVIKTLDLPDENDPVCVVVGMEDETKGERLVLLTSIDLAKDELRRNLAKAGLPNLWIPRDIRNVETIPILPTGKLDLLEVKKLVAES